MKYGGCLPLARRDFFFMTTIIVNSYCRDQTMSTSHYCVSLNLRLFRFLLNSDVVTVSVSHENLVCSISSSSVF